MSGQLLDETISAFLIKGNPGTGKSTLAFELLRMKRKGTYLSTRISREKLVVQNPGLRMITVGSAENELAPGGVKIADLRLSTPRQLVNLVLAEIEEHPEGLIIIDSWDSMAKEMDPKDRLETEKMLVAVAQSRRSQVGFVSEEPNLTTTDYLVDAIVELKYQLHFDRTRRVLEIRKMRGQQIVQPNYLFTLWNGKFEICRPTERASLDKYNSSASKLPELSPNPESAYSYGIIGDNQALKSGIRPGEVFAIQLGKGVSALEFNPLEMVVRASFITKGVGLVVIPPSGVPPDYILGPFRSFLPRSLVDSNVRIGYYEDYEDPCVFKLDSDSIDASFKSLWSEIRGLKGDKNRPCAVSISVDKLELMYRKEENILRNVVTSIARMRHDRDMLELQVNEGELSESIISTADQHWVIEEMYGALVCRFVKPSLPMAAISYDFSKGYPKVSMKQVV